MRARADPYPGVLREVMLARVTGDVAGAQPHGDISVRACAAEAGKVAHACGDLCRL